MMYNRSMREQGEIGIFPAARRDPRRAPPKGKERPWSVFGKGIESAPPPEFSMISMFSGCGGMDLGLRFAGFDVRWANDIDADACETYERNLGEGVIKCADIRTHGLPKKKKTDLLAACFPCQSFSNAGSRRGINDPNGRLHDHALKAVGRFNPKVVIFENVRGMLSVRDGKNLLIEKICEKLRRRGYHAYFRLLNASEHSVPQNRMRVFIVGVRADLDAGEFGFPVRDESKSRMSLGETIMDVRRSAPNFGDAISLGGAAAKMCEKIPESGSWKNILDKELPERFMRIRRQPEVYRAPNFYRRFGRDEVAGTITASFKPENSGVLHPLDNRLYSVREAARIQSFPDWFEFRGKNAASLCRQVGNAVPPRLGYELGRTIADFLKGRPIREPLSKMRLTRFIKEGHPLRLSSPTIKHTKRSAT